MQTFLVLWFPDVALHHSGLTVVYLRHQPSEHLHTYSLINIYRLKNSKKDGTKKKSIFISALKASVPSCLRQSHGSRRLRWKIILQHSHKSLPVKSFPFPPLHIVSSVSPSSSPSSSSSAPPHHSSGFIIYRAWNHLHIFFLFYRLTALIERSLFNDVYCLDW